MPTSFQNRCKLLVASQMAHTLATLSTAQLTHLKAFLYSHFQPIIHSMFYIIIMNVYKMKVYIPLAEDANINNINNLKADN